MPGSDLTCRVRSFTKETAAGGEVVYSFTDVKPGTYLYQSGTLPQIQVQMGLYGMMRKNATSPLTPGANAYDNVTFDKQVPLILSEVDPVVHAQVATGSFTGSTLNYDPKFFRIPPLRRREPARCRSTRRPPAANSWTYRSTPASACCCAC